MFVESTTPSSTATRRASSQRTSSEGSGGRRMAHRTPRVRVKPVSRASSSRSPVKTGISGGQAAIIAAASPSIWRRSQRSAVGSSPASRARRMTFGDSRNEDSAARVEPITKLSLGHRGENLETGLSKVGYFTDHLPVNTRYSPGLRVAGISAAAPLKKSVMLSRAGRSLPAAFTSAASLPRLTTTTTFEPSFSREKA